MGTTTTMKSKQTIIPIKLREEMALDPFYSTCALYGQTIQGQLHYCEGKITWEHAMIFAGKKIQKKWAIIPLCEKGHAVNTFQDAGTLNKEVNVWVALNRATRADLEEYTKPGVMFNKVDYFRELKRLNAIYGVYEHKKAGPIPSPLSQSDVAQRPLTGISEVLRVEIPPPLSTDIVKACEYLKKVVPGMNPAQFIIEAVVTRLQAVDIIKQNPPPLWPPATEK